MTLDITIGCLKISSCEDIIKNCTRYEEYKLSLSLVANVEMCPEVDYDVCDKEYTSTPCSACRSGSLGFWDFFNNYTGRIYKDMRYNPHSNDIDIALLSPFIEEINALPDSNLAPVDADRMKWFKFWCNRAVELYGDKAAIMFS